MTKRPSIFSRQRFGFAAAGTLLALCVAYLLPAAQTSEIILQPKELVAPSTSQAVETPVSPEKYENHTVPPDLPRYLSIEKFGVTSRILKVGIDKSGAVDAPASIHDVGWYSGSAKPGHAGVMFLDGHVSGPTQPGVFKKLGTLTPGDSVKIQRGDGSTHSYEVTSTRLVPEKDVNMDNLLKTSNQDEERLVMMTCGGRFDRQTDQFNDRVIVQAVKRS